MANHQQLMGAESRLQAALKATGHVMSPKPPGSRSRTRGWCWDTLRGVPQGGRHWRPSPSLDERRLAGNQNYNILLNRDAGGARAGAYAAEPQSKQSTSTTKSFDQGNHCCFDVLSQTSPSSCCRAAETSPPRSSLHHLHCAIASSFQIRVGLAGIPQPMLAAKKEGRD